MRANVQSDAQTGEQADAQVENQGGEQADEQKISILDYAKNAYAAVKNWLFEDVNAAKGTQQTGTLVRVEVGLQNDEYAEIVSGVSEGDVLLYTSTDTDTSSMFRDMGGGRGGDMGGMGGMGGMPGF